VPAARVPLSNPAELKVTPLGNVPVLLNVGAGYPVATAVNEPDVPTVKVALLALVIAGAWSTEKLLLVVPVSNPSVAESVNDPLLVGTRFEKVATPPDAVAVNVAPLLNTPPLLIAIVTVELSAVSTSPLLSSTLTVTAGEMEAPDAVSLGCVLNFSEAGVCGQGVEANGVAAAGSYTQMRLLEDVKGTSVASAYVNLPEELMGAAAPMGVLQALSPQILPGCSVSIRIETIALVPSVVTLTSGTTDTAMVAVPVLVCWAKRKMPLAKDATATRAASTLFLQKARATRRLQPVLFALCLPIDRLVVTVPFIVPNLFIGG
jgi:hypothetical protein